MSAPRPWPAGLDCDQLWPQWPRRCKSRKLVGCFPEEKWNANSQRNCPFTNAYGSYHGRNCIGTMPKGLFYPFIALFIAI